MSVPDEVRPEVVEAIVAVLRGGHPADLPPGATAAEKAAAKDAYLSEFLAERGKRDRQSHAWELLLTRSYDEPPAWKQIFDDLSPEVHAELGELYAALPAGAQEGYARRFGVPSAVCRHRPVHHTARRVMTRPVTAPGRLVAGRYRLQSRLGRGGKGTGLAAPAERPRPRGA